jgi:outer membrane protein assembly factor BamB
MMKRSPTMSVVAVLMLAAPLMGADWLQFRGSDSQSASTERGLPPAFDSASGENVAWKTALPGRGPSSPIVVGQRVFITAATGARQDRLHVLCFHADDGRPLWRRQFWATGHTLVNPYGGVAAPTPSSDGKLVVASFSSNDVVCLDLEGRLQWVRGLSLEHPQARNDVGMASSPAIFGPTVVVQVENLGDSFATGLDLATGKTRWRIDREPGAVWSSPTVLRGPTTADDLVLLHGRQKLSALNPQTGTQVWEYEAPCHTIASVATAGDRIYLPAIGLHALRYDAASRSVEKLWYEDRLRSDNPSPVAYEGNVYVIKPPGILMCAGHDGATKWQRRLTGPFWATPLAADGRLYCVNHAGLVQIVDLASEGDVLATAQIDEGVLASPAVADGAIYFRSDQHLWKIATKRKAE